MNTVVYEYDFIKIPGEKFPHVIVLRVRTKHHDGFRAIRNYLDSTELINKAITTCRDWLKSNVGSWEETDSLANQHFFYFTTKSDALRFKLVMA